MGIKKFLAKKGAVGGAARWAIKGYRAYINIEKNPKLNNMLRFLVSARFEIDAKGHEEILLEMINKNEIRGLAHLVTLILIAEAGYSENTEENKAMFREVILEELNSASIPPNFIHSVVL